MKIKFYGTRGSIPVSDPKFQKFGGNTPCVMISHEDQIGIFDAGTGIRNLGKDLIESRKENLNNIFIVFSHFHWDHIQGFPFFIPAYDPKREFTIATIGRTDKYFDLKSIFVNQMRAEFFPIPLAEMGAKINFFQEEGDFFSRNNVKVNATEHNHPGGAYSYRIEAGGKTVVYSTDVEHGMDLDYRVVQIAQNADLLIHDAQYTPEELKEKYGWGHSSWEQAIKVAELAKVKRLVLTHHDPDHDDDFLMDVEKKCKEKFPNVVLARENMEIEI
ncbi:MAG: MBL fold metallo-hydrolase [Melioribacteraceae bacterium]|nr:MBL fold metallo-hydrolase [Melioribacteraceae bacterium]